MSTFSPLDSTVTVMPSTVPVKETRPRPEAPMSQRRVRGRRHCGGMSARLSGNAWRMTAMISSNISQVTA